MAVSNIVFLVVLLSRTTNAQYDDQYKVEVVAFHPQENAPMQANWREYERIIQNSYESDTQIIVFPEYGLTGYPIKDKVQAINFDESNNILQEMKAFSSRVPVMYIVLNVLEKHKGHYYSTTFALHNSSIRAKYRKINVRVEEDLSAGTQLEVLETDFGHFGLLTSQDIMYKNPAGSFINETICQVLHVSCMNMSLPHFAPLSVQTGYAKAFQRNVFTSAYNDPDRSLSGTVLVDSEGNVVQKYTRSKTGFLRDKFNYACKRPYSYVISTIGEYTMQSPKKMFSLQHYVFRDLDPKTIKKGTCLNFNCCVIGQIQDEIHPNEVYKLVLDKTSSSCGLVACQNHNHQRVCYQNFTPQSKFLSLTVTVKAQLLLLPITINYKLLPLLNYDFDYNKSLKKVQVYAKGSVTNILEFGLFALSSSSCLLNDAFILVLIVSVALLL